VLIVEAARSEPGDRALEEADRVLLVADAGKPAAGLTATARGILEAAALPAQVEQELLIVRETPGISATAPWLRLAPFARHHHARAGDDGDLQRLLRHLRGQSVLLVLSGGGLRGWVHLGAIRALEERRIPLDGMGGSSIGAVVAACWLAQGTSDGAIASFDRIARAIARSKGVGSLTYPAVSILNGRRWTHALQQELGDRDIEDLPLPFFAISCNLSRNDQVVHRSGKVWEAVRASSALPALLPPMVRDGQLFVDGGIVNNVPVDVARAVMGGSCRTIAIELSGMGELDPREYRFPPVLSFADALLARLRLAHRDYRFISIGEVVLRSLTHGSMARTNENLRGADVVLRPSFANQGFLSAAHPAELVELGYRSMLARLDARGDLG
jgi:NTE family protein